MKQPRIIGTHQHAPTNYNPQTTAQASLEPFLPETVPGLSAYHLETRDLLHT